MGAEEPESAEPTPAAVASLPCKVEAVANDEAFPACVKTSWCNWLDFSRRDTLWLTGAAGEASLSTEEEDVSFNTIPKAAAMDVP